LVNKRIKVNKNMVGDFTSHFYCMLKCFSIILFFLYAENVSAQKLEFGLVDSSNVKGATLLDTAPSDTTPKTKLVVSDSTRTQPVTTTKDTAVAKASSKEIVLDTTKAKHSPKKAALLSAVLPGMGQAYNKKYWKIPVVYAGFAGLGFWMGLNVKNYRTFNDAYKLRVDGDSTTIDRFVGEYSAEDLRTLKRGYRRNLDLSVILTVVWYALNIVDATVDAHLFEFDVSDNLSLRVEPVLEYQSRANNLTGLKVGLRF